MNKKLLLLILPIILILIQFFQPEKNEQGNGSDNIINNKEIPAEIKEIITVSCLDCHSNQTNYKWYDNIAPASWMVHDHISDGKRHLNFSDWGKMKNFDKITALNNISSEISEKKMPLKSYTFMHKEAKLSDEKIQLLSKWCESYSVMILDASKDAND